MEEMVLLPKLEELVPGNYKGFLCALIRQQMYAPISLVYLLF
jgi:hypothetical protein